MRADSIKEAEALANLISKVERLEAENTRLMKMFADDMYIESANMVPGHYDINMRGKGAMLICGQMLQMFRESGGVNFHTSTFQMEFGDPKTFEIFELTIQKVNGDDSPAQKITRLEAENAKLRETVNEARRILESQRVLEWEISGRGSS